MGTKRPINDINITLHLAGTTLEIITKFHTFEKENRMWLKFNSKVYQLAYIFFHLFRFKAFNCPKIARVISPNSSKMKKKKNDEIIIEPVGMSSLKKLLF